jgi:BirA family biotin operon repressor/biotin-[acetyl-CoA-carboxylase] ligase
LSSSRSDLPRDFSEAFDRARARLDGLGSTILFYPTIGSTNDVALQLAAHHGAIVIADQQVAGRGRRGRTWFSPPRSGLYVSMVLAPARARRDADRATTLLTLMAGVALTEGIETETALRADIKWPNDLYIGRRKFAGILAESAGSKSDAVVLGYGINVAATVYPTDVADRATSIETELGRPVDRAMLCVETVAAIARRYADLVDGRFDAILDAWRARAPGSRGARVVWQSPSGPRAGVTAGVDDRGALLVDVGGSLERIVAGELTWI